MDIASRGRTTVLVSHRPTTHGWVDRVVQVVGGAIVADSPASPAEGTSRAS